MKRAIIVIILSFISCNKSNTENVYQGDVYIKLIDVASLYGAPKEMIDKIKNRSTSVGIKISDSIDDENTRYFKRLIKHDLIDKPCFKLKFIDGEIVTVFTNESSYVRVKPLIDSLNRDTEKIIVKFKGIEKERGIFYTDKIISVIKTEGTTDWDK